jgi:hypothetical protein
MFTWTDLLNFNLVNKAFNRASRSALVADKPAGGVPAFKAFPFMNGISTPTLPLRISPLLGGNYHINIHHNHQLTVQS